MVPAVLDTASYPTLEGILGNDASARGVPIRENNSEADLEFDLGTEGAEGDVLVHFEAPDVIRRRDRDFDNYPPVNRVPAMPVCRSCQRLCRRGYRRIVLFALCKRTVGVGIRHAPKAVSEPIGGI